MTRRMDPQNWQKINELFFAARDLEPGAREVFLSETCSGNEELRKEVGSLVAAHLRANSFIGASAFADGARLLAAEDANSGVGRAVGPYKLVRQIGSGGMGAVYLAERDDDQYHKKVAIKLVRIGLDAQLMVRRFRSERQILALLEHPHVARLLDGGVSADGQPYIVMEYIEGARITDYCKSNNLNISQRLLLFRQICSAVHYAHQHLVVHRDIKPSNILVSKDGAPKLLDFGIAKILDSSAAGSEGSTLTNLNPMTPEYASPEQIQGKVLTTATDIYSLGVLLYELLTYQKPFKTSDKTPQEVARLVCESEPQKPSTATTTAAIPSAAARPEAISGDLDHIVLKAMRKEPSQRYASAEELSGDVGNYLAGLPVRAREGSFRYLAGKLVARHKSVVALSSALLLALVAGLVLVSWQVHVAHVERARAQMERANAQRRFNDVRKLANSLIFEVHDGIQDLPGSTPIRKLVVTRAAEYLDSLAKDTEGDSGLQMELAGAYMRLGNVQLSKGTASLGDHAGATASYQKAEALLHSVLSRDRSNVEARKDLAACYEHDSSLYDVDTPQAHDAAQEALKISQELVRERPNDEALEQGLATAFFRFGNSLGFKPERIDYYSRALEIYQRRLAAHHDSLELQRDSALMHKYIGQVHLENDKGEQAIEHFQAALELDSKLAKANPNNAQAQLDVSFDLSQIGNSYYWQRKNLAAALENFQRTLEIRRKLLKADPTNHTLQGRIAYVSLMIGRIFREMGKTRESLAYYRSVAAIASACVAKDPGDATNRSYLGYAYQGIGMGQDRLARTDGGNKQEYKSQACASYRKSYEAFRPNIGLPATDTDKNQKQTIKDVTEAVARCSK